MRVLALAAVILGAWMLAPSRVDPTAQAFRAKLGAVCANVHGAPSAEQGVQGLRALDAPSALDAGYREFVTAVEHSWRLTFAFARAERSDDQRAKRRLAAEARKLLHDASTAAGRLGVPECAAPVLSESAGPHVHPAG
jgi:hypothetical protein